MSPTSSILTFSLLRFCETTFGVKPLSTRDAAADDMSDCFDFTQVQAPPPAITAQGRGPRRSRAGREYGE